MLVPADVPAEVVDVTAAIFEPTMGHELLEDVFDETADRRTP